VEKNKNKSFYRVTQLGWKLLWTTITSKSYFENSILSKSYKKDVKQALSQTSNFEEGYKLINQGLNLVTQELGFV